MVSGTIKRKSRKMEFNQTKPKVLYLRFFVVMIFRHFVDAHQRSGMGALSFLNTLGDAEPSGFGLGFNPNAPVSGIGGGFNPSALGSSLGGGLAGGGGFNPSALGSGAGFNLSTLGGAQPSAGANTPAPAPVSPLNGGAPSPFSSFGFPTAATPTQNPLAQQNPLQATPAQAPSVLPTPVLAAPHTEPRPPPIDIVEPTAPPPISQPTVPLTPQEQIDQIVQKFLTSPPPPAVPTPPGLAGAEPFLSPEFDLNNLPQVSWFFFFLVSRVFLSFLSVFQFS